MKVSLKWLKDYAPFKINAQDLSDRLTMAGLEVEKVLNIGGDTVFELEVTPNRADCLSHFGVARELSAILDVPLKDPRQRKVQLPNKKCEISIEDKTGCLRYWGAVIEAVTVRAVEGHVGDRIKSLGIRPINNIVDITNFCLMESGQPLHAFDFDRLVGGKIIVRKAKKGERIVTIDGIDRELDPSILVIADAKRPVAIAGIMGGKDTEVTDTTKNILLESAYFDPILIRRASRKLGLRSDSSYRFERGVSYADVALAGRRAAGLILASAGGRIVRAADRELKKTITKSKPIPISVTQINDCLETSLTSTRIQKILTRLNFVVKVKHKTIVVAPPSGRGDIHRDVDIIEEVARVIGYDRLPFSLPEIKAAHFVPGQSREIKRVVREVLVSQGCSEIITYTMTNFSDLKRCQQGDLQGSEIQNPLTQDQQVLRPTILPAFLDVVSGNFNRGQKDLKLFEIGKIYHKSTETELVGILMTGMDIYDWRMSGQHEMGFFDLKGAIGAIFERLKIDSVEYKAVKLSCFVSGQAAEVFVGGKVVGQIGKINGQILSEWDIKQRNVYFAQIEMDQVYQKARLKEKYHAVSEFPAVTRDISVAVKQETTYGMIKDFVDEQKFNVLAAVDLKEEYLGDKIPSGCRGLVFSLSYQSASRTLKETEVNEAHEKIVQGLKGRFGAIIR